VHFDDLPVPCGFTCLRCGRCCLGPGEVYLAEGEEQAIAQSLGIAVTTFTAEYTRLADDRQGLSLTERSDGACIFLQADNTCRIQTAKPRQCRAFPHLWRSARLASICAGWQAAAHAAQDATRNEPSNNP
jgi:Fe-S-cluster containining protein